VQTILKDKKLWVGAGLAVGVGAAVWYFWCSKQCRILQPVTSDPLKKSQEDAATLKEDFRKVTEDVEKEHDHQYYSKELLVKIQRLHANMFQSHYRLAESEARKERRQLLRKDTQSYVKFVEANFEEFQQLLDKNRQTVIGRVKAVPSKYRLSLEHYLKQDPTFEEQIQKPLDDIVHRPEIGHLALRLNLKLAKDTYNLCIQEFKKFNPKCSPQYQLDVRLAYVMDCVYLDYGIENEEFEHLEKHMSRTNKISQIRSGLLSFIKMPDK
jgi:F0F1-type ATP synthase membrane subunit b/b'